MARYLQQIIVPEIGLLGQEKIKLAKVLIIGAGGLGTPVATYLAAAGIGTIGMIDNDVISESNLQRQFLYSPSEVGLKKVDVLKYKLAHQNPDIQIETFPFFIDESNATEIISKFDIVCDCTDNVNARILIDAVCPQHNKPLVYAAVRDWQAYITVLHHKNKIQLSNIFSISDLQNEAQNNCSIAGIVNTTCGVAGSLQATEVLKIILGLESILDGEILCVNTLYSVFRKFKIRIATKDFK